MNDDLFSPPQDNQISEPSRAEVPSEFELALKLPDGIYHCIPEDIYHKLPYCSSTYLRKLLINPAEAQVETDEESTSKTLGRAIHALTLEGEEAFQDRFIFVPENAPRRPSEKQINAKKPTESTLIAIDWWNRFDKEADGKTALSASKEEIVRGCVKSIKEHPVTSNLLKSGHPEMTIIFTDSATGIRCKVRIDLFDNKLNAPVDLKSTADARILYVQRSISKYKYITQAGHYINGLEAVEEYCDNFIFAFVQTKPTFLVCAGMVDQEKLEAGKKRANFALHIEKECRALGFYPNIELPNEITTLYEIYNEDRTVKNDALLFQVFSPPEWGI